MKKKDILTIIIFILLILAIIFIFFIDALKHKKYDNIDRKIEYIMGYNYNTIINKGESLFFNTIELINNNNVFSYEKNLDNSLKYYSIDSMNKCLKINNFGIAISNFSDNSLKDYTEYKNIVYFENNYYIKELKENNTNYIGSIIDIDKYENNIVYFKTKDFYCNNSSYLGALDDIPNCKYDMLENTFSIILEKGTFKINNFKDFINY